MATDSTVIAFFAALAATPPDEIVPSVDASLLTDSDRTLDKLQQTTADLPFWQRFEQFHNRFVAGYTVKPRAKMLDPTPGSDEVSDQFADTQETVNVSLPAGAILDSPDPAAIAREQFQNSPWAKIGETAAAMLEWSRKLFE
ncbi:MAG: hypothetical protein ACPGVO_11350 [Spirulinaceae cyanobacterium]